MTKIRLKVYKAKCIAPIAIHGIGDCLPGIEYELNEDQLKYNGGAFDYKNAKPIRALIIDDEVPNTAEGVFTKAEIIEQQMADNNKVALAKEAEAAKAQGMSVLEYREYLKQMRKPAAAVAQGRIARGKVLSKLLKDPLTELAKGHGLPVAETDTREQLIGKILDVEFKILPQD